MFSKKWEPVIGLEIHAQLKTKTKLFSSDSTDFGQKPNTQISPVTLGLPGSLPVLNEAAVHMGIKAGLSLGCKINKTSVFARKNYLYPDLPKGYQISQDKYPLCGQGNFSFFSQEKLLKVRIERCHLEEDAGQSFHFEDKTLVNFNRAGVPLLEIVSFPDMRSPLEASDYAKAIRRILRYIKVCDGNLEEGSLRCDCNVSIRLKGEKKLGNRVELKNINSFRFIEKALTFEIQRQVGLLEKGDKVEQQTRLYDSKKNQTVLMRKKEDSQDYKYFPEPDLKPLVLNENKIQKAKAEITELPLDKTLRFQKEFRLPLYDSLVLTGESEIAFYFEEVMKKTKLSKQVSNWIMTEILGRLNETKTSFSKLPIRSEALAELVDLIEEDYISGKIGKQVFLHMWENPEKQPKDIVEEKGWKIVTDDHDISALIDEILQTYPDQRKKYLEGKDKLFGFFVGKIMAKTKGLASPKKVNDILKIKLKK